jgi:hypothetical protein
MNLHSHQLTFDLRYTLPDDPVENKDGFLVYEQ